MRVALVCPSVGLTQRGYERFITDLFRTVTPDVDVTLFKGAGPEDPHQKVIPHLNRSGWLADVCFGRLRYARYYLEFSSFALALAPSLVQGRFDVIHFIDPVLAPMLHFIRRGTGLRSRLLFTDAGAIPYESSRWVDHVHCLTLSSLDVAKGAGVPAEHLSMIPVGVDPERFRAERSRAEIRREAGIDENAIVVLAVASVNRHHKRIDYLIEEVAKLHEGYHLWLDGSLHPDGDASLLDLAREKLGSRFHYTYVPSSEVGNLYRAADILVSAAVQESFGMALVEAASCGIPVIAHDSAHFRWLLGEYGNFTDMNRAGNLSAFLRNFRDYTEKRDQKSPLQRYNWQNLKGEYADMYARLAETAY